MDFFIGLAVFILIMRLTPVLVRRIGGQTADRGELRKQVEDAERRLSAMEGRLRGLSEGTDERLLDLEDRLDFTERALKQQPERRRLPE